ncbi:hypothetical protein JYT71_00210 [Acidimicrobiaceae bacterium AH-315-P05]|nr:hypothetical protein [Acidimicrobiaceae bacterium AH-315-P05]
MTGHDSKRAWSDAVGIAVERLVAPVEGIHKVIIDPWLSVVSPGGAEAYHSALTRIYNSVGLGAAKGAAAAGAIRLPTADRPERVALRDSKFGLGMQAFSNGVWGDELERRGSPAHIQLELRDTDGEVIGLTSTGLARAFPQATDRIVVLLHGLGQTERKWQTRAGEPDTDQGLADVLERGGFTPLLVRYNSGRHVPHNGADLANLISTVSRAWPHQAPEVALVGFSMGGLVARSAILAGRDAEHAWPNQVSHLVTLATPHLGSPIEKGARAGAWALRLSNNTKPLGDFVDTRSQGIKDLRHGTVVSTRTVVHEALPGRIKQHFLTGVTTADPKSLVGRLVGDFVVRPSSGTGLGARCQLDPDDVRIIAGVRHTGLFHNPEVHRQVVDWLGESRTANA